MFSHPRRWLALAAVLAIACGALFLTRDPEPTSAVTGTPTTTGSPVADGMGSRAGSTGAAVVPGGPPVETSPPASVATDPPFTAAPGDVDVVMTYATWNPDAAEVEAGGYVTGVIESGGTCTLTLTRGGQTRTSTSRAVPDATSTACPTISVADTQLTAGTWRAQLSYISPDSSGTSDAAEVTVP